MGQPKSKKSKNLRPFFIAMNLHPDNEATHVSLLVKFKGMFGWIYEDMEGILTKLVSFVKYGV